MGILNVTPDSFYDGGRFGDPDAALRRCLQMVADGADIIDVGGESTRPRSAAYGQGAEPVPVEEELQRVLPVIDALVGEIDIPVSIDTYKSEVADAALRAGAVLVNDVSGFTYDASMPEVIARHKASAIVMHMKGTPQSMQVNPQYTDLFGEIGSFLERAIQTGKEEGVSQIIVDPGLGFGKSVDDNLQLLVGLERFRWLGCPILVGPSRKSFLGALLELPIEERLEGTLAACVVAILSGAQILRVHDVLQARRAAVVADALRRSRLSLEQS
jgi:dihydropteroate synthase